ncbi:MAG: phage major capsid protein [Lachnospiraceae bacterium]|nr:phage major capsid protein [Lachnospiraceae bacterium]
MTREEIMALDIEQIDKRNAEIVDELREADAEGIERLNDELDAIRERREVIKLEVEQRKLDMAAVIKGQGDVIEEVKDERKVTTMEVRNTPEYINAFAEYIKSGNDMECRKLTSENDTTPNGTGTVAVPEFVYDIVKTAWEREGIMSLVRKSYLRGNLKVQFEISGSDAEIHAEGGAAVNEETLVLGIVTLVPQSIKKWISISDEVYDLRGEEFLRYIYDELTYRIAKKAADTLISKIEACGTVSTTTCPGVPKLQAASPALGTVAAAMALLSDEAANPVVIMNKATWGAFKAVEYAGSFPVDPFEGLPVIFNNKIKSSAAATTGETYAIVGDLGHGALANFPNGDGIDFKFDELSKKKEDLIEVLGREYVALGVVAPNAFVKITK